MLNRRDLISMDVMTPLSDPRLPPELECRIFEAVALAHPTKIPQLMLVAWRVKEWVEPLLYHVIFLTDVSRVTYWQSQGFPIVPPDILLAAIASTSGKNLLAVAPRSDMLAKK
ncbi:hypothetical protein B0H19DRAFT_1185616 [Mycena capillaripes]|nr:hypothetical protein B0H19DRAFT_1185616 [Mycena capillaripes]